MGIALHSEIFLSPNPVNWFAATITTASKYEDSVVLFEIRNLWLFILY